MGQKSWRTFSLKAFMVLHSVLLVQKDTSSSVNMVKHRNLNLPTFSPSHTWLPTTAWRWLDCWFQKFKKLLESIPISLLQREEGRGFQICSTVRQTLCLKHILATCLSWGCCVPRDIRFKRFYLHRSINVLSKVPGKLLIRSRNILDSILHLVPRMALDNSWWTDQNGKGSSSEKHECDQ